MNISKYERLLISNAKEIERYLIHIGASVFDAEDIIQDVFIKMIQADILLTPDKIKAWMYRVALSKFYDLYRRKKRYSEILYQQIALFSEVSETKSFNDDLYNALSSIDDYQMSLITLYYNEKQSINEIAQIYEVSTSKVKTDLFRTRQKLKRKMEVMNNEK